MPSSAHPQATPKDGRELIAGPNGEDEHARAARPRTQRLDPIALEKPGGRTASESARVDEARVEAATPCGANAGTSVAASFALQPGAARSTDAPPGSSRSMRSRTDPSEALRPDRCRRATQDRAGIRRVQDIELALARRHEPYLPTRPHWRGARGRRDRAADVQGRPLDAGVRNDVGQRVDDDGQALCPLLLELANHDRAVSRGRRPVDVPHAVARSVLADPEILRSEPRRVAWDGAIRRWRVPGGGESTQGNHRRIHDGAAGDADRASGDGDPEGALEERRTTEDSASLAAARRGSWTGERPLRFEARGSSRGWPSSGRPRRGAKLRAPIAVRDVELHADAVSLVGLSGALRSTSTRRTVRSGRREPATSEASSNDDSTSSHPDWMFVPMTNSNTAPMRSAPNRFVGRSTGYPRPATPSGTGTSSSRRRITSRPTAVPCPWPFGIRRCARTAGASAFASSGSA